jgi:hypothetical protein
VKGLLLQLDSNALLAQFSRADVHLKHSEAQDCGRSSFKGHLESPL